jgi:hypothetical protein
MAGEAFQADRGPTPATQPSVSRRRFASGVYRVGTFGREAAAFRDVAGFPTQALCRTRTGDPFPYHQRAGCCRLLPAVANPLQAGRFGQGEAGIGKTTLVERFLDELQATRVLRASGTFTLASPADADENSVMLRDCVPMAAMVAVSSSTFSVPPTTKFATLPTLMVVSPPTAGTDSVVFPYVQRNSRASL